MIIYGERRTDTKAEPSESDAAAVVARMKTAIAVKRR